MLTNNPLRVHIYDPTKKQNRRTFVFIGTVPKVIQTAIKQINDKVNKNAEHILKEFYGPSWKKKLHVQAAIGSGEPLEEWISSVTANDPFAGDYIIARLPSKKLTEPSNIVCGGEYRHTSQLADLQIIDVDEIELTLGEPTTQAVSIFEGKISPFVNFAPGVEYVQNVSVYLEDKLSELKEKIYIVTGIPVYRQHIFYIEHGHAVTTYRLYADTTRLIDIRDLALNKDLILDVPIDRMLYDYKEEIKIETLDDFQSIAKIPIDSAVYVVDIAQYIHRSRQQFVNILQDTYQFDMLYYGFVIKYWPQLTQECFHLYVSNEAELAHKFPDLAKQRVVLERKYTEERSIIDSIYKTSEKLQKSEAKIKSQVVIAITQMIATVNAPKYAINLRNLFDELTVSKCIPEIHAYIDRDEKRFFLRKTFIRNESDITFPSNLHTGLIIAISLKRADQESYHKKRAISTMENEQSRYLFFNIYPNGKYFIKSVWNEEDEYSFDDMISIMKKFTDKIINEINAMGKYVFTNGGQLALITQYNLVYNSMNVAIFWKKILTEASFKFIKSLWNPYIRAGIISSKGIQFKDKFEFIFHKGIMNFENVNIEKIITASNNIILRNHYSHLSNPSIKQKWDMVFNHNGRTVIMQHRTTDLKFEVRNITESEFKLFYQYIMGFIVDANCHENIRVISHAPTSTTIKKLKKAKEIDPNLFNLKKYGNKKVYSILCQNPRQPMLYTEEEVASMTQKERDNLTKYWNFTFNRPAYYGCPSKKYPHLSFIVGVHPNNYCLPCCGKKIMTESSKKLNIAKICLDKHVYTEQQEVSVESIFARHIVNYGKEIEVGRLSKLPTIELKNLLLMTVSNISDEEYITEFFIVGVTQYTASIKNIGFIYAFAEAIGLSIEEIIAQIVAGLRKNPNMLNILLGGVLLDTFSNVDELINVLNDIFSGNQFTYDKFRFNLWNDLFMELAIHLWSVYTFVFVDSTGIGNNIKLYITNDMQINILTAEQDKQYILVIKKEDSYYPIFLVDPREYFKSNLSKQKVFDSDSKTVKMLKDIVLSNNTRSQVDINKPADLILMTNFIVLRKYSIEYKLINRQNMCYALLVKLSSNKFVYVPIVNSVYTTDETKTYFKSFKRTDFDVDYKYLEEYMFEFNKYIEGNYKISSSSQETKDMYLYAKIEPAVYLKYKTNIIGFEATTGLLYYFATSNSVSREIPTRELMYDYDDVNEAIVTKREIAKDRRIEGVGRSLYNNYMYQLFVIEFLNYLESERNTKVRTKLAELANKIDIKGTSLETDIYNFQIELKKMIPEYQTDIIILHNQLNDYIYNHQSKQAFVAAIDKTIYSFDKLTLTLLKSMTHNDMIVALTKISNKFSIEKNLPENIKFPNIYLPCNNTNNDASYCVTNKLAVKNRSQLIEVLATDIANPIKEKYLQSGLFTDNTVEYFKFKQRPNEIISISKITQRKTRNIFHFG